MSTVLSVTAPTGPAPAETTPVAALGAGYAFAYVGYRDPIAEPLLRDLEREYDERYGIETFGEAAIVELERYPAEDFAPPRGSFLLLLHDGEPISGGAFMPYDGITAEMKRVWTRGDRRGEGLARVVLTELEAQAARLGYERIYLTTGPRQPEARALYLRHGYTPLFDTSLTGEQIGGLLPFEKSLISPDAEPVARAEQIARAPQQAPQNAARLVDRLRERHSEIEVLAPGSATADYRFDAFPIPKPEGIGPAVAFPESAAQVQALVREAAALGVSVVARGAGTGLSGGANADERQLVISTERMTRIVEISPDDEVAVVEPGVLNAELNRALAPFGLFFAPDPASHQTASIGGNVATNAGGLHCAKYGVTRESVLALDVVLADGELISVGHRSIKGVTGLDLVSLFVGSEGILGIVVGATLRLHPLPAGRRTVTAFFDDAVAGARSLGAIRRTPVRPAAVEFFDGGTLEAIDEHSGTRLRERGAALALIELDGYGLDEQTRDLREALEGAGGRVAVEDEAAAERLWELRRTGRGFPDDAWFASGDIAVPVSKVADVYAAIPQIAEKWDVELSAVSHAGDGNLHPVVVKRMPRGADPAVPAPEVHAALDDTVRLALALGGTVSGEHGIGSLKREFAALELSPRSLAAQHAIRRALDPHDTLNPGKAL
ncbi:MAG: GNAT family N-acetyltransferase [Leucobacter sp.]